MPRHTVIHRSRNVVVQHERIVNGVNQSRSAPGGMTTKQRVTFLIDASASMTANVRGTNESRIAAVCKAAKLVTKKMNNDDPLTVTVFSCRAKTITPPEGMSKSSYDAALVESEALLMQGSTAMWAALWGAMAGAKDDCLHQIVVFTDGDATDGGSSAQKSVTNGLRGEVSNLKIYFVTSGLSGSSEAALTALNNEIVQVIKLDKNFNVDALDNAFEEVSTQMADYSYYYYHRASSEDITITDDGSDDDNGVRQLRYDPFRALPLPSARSGGGQKHSPQAIKDSPPSAARPGSRAGELRAQLPAWTASGNGGFASAGGGTIAMAVSSTGGDFADMQDMMESARSLAERMRMGRR